MVVEEHRLIIGNLLRRVQFRGHQGGLRGVNSITPARKFRILAHTNPNCASEGSAATFPSLARWVRMSFFGVRVICRA